MRPVSAQHGIVKLILFRPVKTWLTRMLSCFHLNVDLYGTGFFFLDKVVVAFILKLPFNLNFPANASKIKFLLHALYIEKVCRVIKHLLLLNMSLNIRSTEYQQSQLLKRLGSTSN